MDTLDLNEDSELGNGDFNNTNNRSLDFYQLRGGESIFNSPLFISASYIFIITGVAAAIMNFSIFSILVQKKKKMASEHLVVANLFIDGCYGLLLVLIGSMNLTEIDLDALTGLDFANCAAGKVPGSLLIFASLCLVMVMLFNRYMAIQHPAKYKEVFSPKMVRLYFAALILVSGTVAGIDLGICIADPSLQSWFAESFSVFWVYAKLFLVLVASIEMILVYKIIAKKFSGSFWRPILLPFRIYCESSKTSVEEAPNLAQHNALPKMKNELTPLITRKNNLARCPEIIPRLEVSIAVACDVNDCEHAISTDNSPGSKRQTGSPEKSPIELCRQQSSSNIPPDSNGEYASRNCSPESNQEHERSPEERRASRFDLKNSKSPRYFAANLRVLHIPKDDNEITIDNLSSKEGPAAGEHHSSGGKKGPARETKKGKRQLTLQQQKHYVTTIFFFVCVLFLAVSLPSALANLVSHLFEDYLSIKAQFRLYLLTEILYGANFLLNPYLFSFNNSYLKEQLATYKLTKCFFAN